MFIQEFYSNIHGINTSTPQFATTFRGTRIVVTPNLIHVPRVAHPDYPGYDRLRTVSKDELLSHFCEIPSIWGEKQNTPRLGFAKGSRFLNMVMTFTLTPLSHYNSITEPRARFLLSLLEDLTINFPSHFITSVIDVYQDTATRDKLIFPLAITCIIRHLSIPIPTFPYYTTMGVINANSVWRSKAQLRPKQPQTETTDPTASIVPSSLIPSTSVAGGMTLEAIMVQLQHIDARLDTLTDELCQVNTHVSHIARQQARLGGFAFHLLLQRLRRRMVMVVMMMRMKMLTLPVTMR